MDFTVFISWSGQKSKEIAKSLAEWLESFFVHGLEVWLSEHDIEAGSRWGLELSERLEQSSFGIICLTPDNINAPWILFEAGALSKKTDGVKVIPFLVGLNLSDITFPLAQFQGVQATKAGVLKLIESINNSLPDKIDSEKLRMQYEKWWQDLEKELLRIARISDSERKKERSDREILEEILELTRGVATRPISQPSGSFIDGKESSKKTDNRTNPKSHLIEILATKFPELSKGSIWNVITCVEDGEKAKAIARIRRETGMEVKRAQHLVETITTAARKYNTIVEK